MKTFIIMNFLKYFCMPVIFLSMIVTPVFYMGCSDSGNTISPPPPPPGGGIVTDIDSNIYPTVQIGNQVWMAANLMTTRYNDGTVIPNVTNNSQWENLTTGAWVNYNNQISNDTVYGKLYNWFAVSTGKLCPEGWRIPSEADWTVLINNLGGDSIAGGKMKSTGIQYWDSPNIAATNSSGFSGLPGGYRYEDGQFTSITHFGYWWSSTEVNKNFAWFRYLYYLEGIAYRYSMSKHSGLSCRCIMN